MREIFERISAEARRIVPHDFLMLGPLSEDRQRVRPIALSGELPECVGDVALAGQLRLAVEKQAFVTHDSKARPDGRTITARICFEGGETFEPIEMEMQPLFRQLLLRGLRSYLRVPVNLRGGVLGGLIFCSSAPEAYQPADLALARHIANMRLQGPAVGLTFEF